MVLRIILNADNAAFTDAADCEEAARILRKLAETIDGNPLCVPGYHTPLHDVNGNEVGFCDILDSDDPNL